MKHVAYGIKYIINHQVFGKKTPLICGLTVTNKCNLQCRHCRIPARGVNKMSFEEAIRVIDLFYEKGGRTLYIQGGEPFIWNDGTYTIEDIVEYSHNSGYYATIIYTNGTLPIKTKADTVFVSIDGLQETHDYLRGKTFDKIIRNIRDSNHSSLYLNSTLNNYNKSELLALCEYVNEIEGIKGIFFYFHTPYYGYDDLYIEPNERIEILRNLLNYKSKYKILNSRAGIKSAIKNNWKRPLDICQVYEKGKIYKCCRYPNNPDLCENCGYLSYAEIDQTLKLKPSAILNALKYF